MGLAKISGAPSAPRTDRVVETEWQYNGRHVEPGVELSVKGERGRFRFVAHVLTDKGEEWIDCYGGPDNREAFRSFRPERITTVHRTTRSR